MARRTREEAYHWSQAASLLNQRLSQETTTFVQAHVHDSDALRVTSTLMGLIAFSSIEASQPSEAWPLKNNNDNSNNYNDGLGSEGLDWLKVLDGKNVVWKLAGPVESDSIFETIYADIEASTSTETNSVEQLPEALISLCQLPDPRIVKKNKINPYEKPARILSRLWDIECDQSNFHLFFPFLFDMDVSFQQRLREKDPRALLLLAFWYAKVRHGGWWLTKRATLESQAICLFLEKQIDHTGDGEVKGLLDVLKVRCGLND